MEKVGHFGTTLVLHQVIFVVLVFVRFQMVEKGLGISPGAFATIQATGVHSVLVWIGRILVLSNVFQAQERIVWTVFNDSRQEVS